MKNLDNDQDQKNYWLGLEEYSQDPEYLKKVENEFLSSPLKEGDAENSVDRRDFLKLMGASIALTSAGCLRRPVQKIVPYVKRAPELTIGVANYYASSWFDGVTGQGYLVKTREGRPLFVSGNPDFPMNGAGLTPRASASLLSLYDTDRLRVPVRGMQNKERSNSETVGQPLEDMDTKIAEALKAGQVRVLTGHMPSPSTKALLEEFTSAFGGQHVQWNPVTFESLKEAQKQSYGSSVVPRYRFDLAKVIVSVDCDFLGTYLSPAEFAKLFASRRNPDAEKGVSRFVAFESQRSITGMNADDRFRIKPSQQITAVMGLAHELVVKQKKSGLGGGSEVLGKFANAAAELGIDSKVFSQLASQLWDARGESLVIAGGVQAESAEGVQLQIAVNYLNSLLENDGKTIDHSVSPFLGLDGSYQDLKKLIEEMNAGKVQTLIIDGSINPSFQLPEAYGFKKALQKVKTIVSLSNYIDETSLSADYIIPEGMAFENWNDYEFQKGLLSIQQPTIQPMFGSRSLGDSLIAWMKKADKGGAGKSADNFYAYLKNRWMGTLAGAQGNLAAGAGEDRWVSLLHEGFYTASNREGTGSSRGFNVSALSSVHPQKSSEIELSLYMTAGVGDGSMANNAWIQEMPDPVTKIVWDNYLEVSPAYAEKNKLKDGSMVKLTVAEKSVEVPVHVLPGQHDQVVSLALGYGRKAKTLKVGHNLGQDAYLLAQMAASGAVIFTGLPAKVEKVAGKYRLANTQGHHSMEGRELVLETRVSDYAKDKTAGKHIHKFMEDIWTPRTYKGHKWAMAIDLSTCIGCSTCVVACQSENNIPVVGKKYVLEGREMHWIRIDRYWAGTAENPDAVMQPVMCQQCENAPCERVCPVQATTHTDEGLNDMVYNRCVGTRYCSNNCPYKVRRFNWFNFTGHFEDKKDTTHMALNPDVTVRSRGVMEKCTFCVQRIQEGKGVAKNEGRELKDGEIKTACQSVCPTNAIIFGDLADPKSAVSLHFKKERRYMLLEEQNTRARVNYLAKVRNTDRALLSKKAHGHEEQTTHDEPKHGNLNSQQGAGEQV